MHTHLISAICTPLQEDHSLHLPGLEAHISDQWQHGIRGLLVAGTMGLMQLQSDRTYQRLIEHCVHLSRGQGEIWVGVGDTSFARTRDRIEIAEQFRIDGVVVLSPYLVKYSQKELIDYFNTLADCATTPLYLYDLPQLTGTKLELQTVRALANHPNILGIKCSGAWEDTRQLIDCIGSQLRVIPAQPHLVDQLIRVGVRDNLDGIFGIAPRLSIDIAQAAESGDWTKASQLQQKISQLLQLLREKYTVFAGCEVILNARGIPGRITCAPMQRLSNEARDGLLMEPVVQEILSTTGCQV